MDTSASGNAYFVGRIGAAKVAMFLDKWAEGDTPVWELFVQDGDRPARRLRMPGRWPTAPGYRRSAATHPRASWRLWRR